MSKKYHKEYNLLTKRLLEKSYTAENYPDYVKIGVYGSEKSLDNFQGGFCFERDWIIRQTFKTHCGLLCKGLACQSDMSHMGIDWIYENDMATILCPYDKKNCTLKHKYLQKPGGFEFICDVHMANERYQYEGSVEQIRKQHEEEIAQKEAYFRQQRKGRACRDHMWFDRNTQEWNMYYDPYHCGMRKCTGVCPVLGRELDKRRGNVFYDVKIKYLRCDLEGTLFAGQVDTEIIKGRKLFKHPVSLDIARICAKLCRKEITDKESSRYFDELFFAKYHGEDFSFEILNIRAESRESRDLMQDLADLQNGIQIVHASDLEKRGLEAKRTRRKKARDAKIKRLEKKLLEAGYWNLDEYSPERRYADKCLSRERIAELEELRLKKQKEEEEQPVQMSLFDIDDGIGGNVILRRDKEEKRA